MLVDKAGFGRHLDEHALRPPLVAPDIELMPDVLHGTVAAAIRREPLDTSELIKGRGRRIDIDRDAARHGGLNRGIWPTIRRPATLAKRPRRSVSHTLPIPSRHGGVSWSRALSDDR